MKSAKEYGKPFWIAFTAFFANLLALTGLDKLDESWISNFWAAFLSSVIVALFVFGKEQVSTFNKEKDKK
jgi:hypothetical protein